VGGCHAPAPRPLDRASEQKITDAAVPEKTRLAFEKDHPNVHVEEARKLIKNNGDVHYEFKFEERDGRKGEAEYDAQGAEAIP
jgi:uncharacterized membrane protein YkoI